MLLLDAGLMRKSPRPEQADEIPAKAERPRFCRFCGCSADLHGEANGDPFAFCPI
jgi:hypothetical protein